jgi:hypothetical protein
MPLAPVKKLRDASEQLNRTVPTPDRSGDRSAQEQGSGGGVGRAMWMVKLAATYHCPGCGEVRVFALLKACVNIWLPSALGLGLCCYR